MMSRGSKIFLTIAIIASVLSISARVSNAQLPENFSFDPNLLPTNLPGLANYTTIKIFPENPGPGKSVTANLELYLTDLNKAEISWFLNGEMVEKGIGNKSFRFQTGQVGSVSRVSVLIVTFEGESVEKEIVIRPAEVDILWNASTYTPPFYEGKALFTNQSEVRLSALPNITNSSGSRVSPENLVFRWYKGNTFIQSDSGFGKNTLTLKGGVLFKSLDIKVEVATLDNSSKAENRIIIPSENPLVLIYEEHPLFGTLLNKSLTDFVLKEKEIKLSAVPYFFDTSSKNSASLEYIWNQNLGPVSELEQPSEIVLRQTESSEAGTVNIGVRVSDKNNNFSKANKNVRITIEN